MKGEITTALYKLGYDLNSYVQSKIVSLNWTIQKYESLLENQSDLEIRTNGTTDFEESFDADCKVQLRLRFLGRGVRFQFYYLAPYPVFLKIDLKSNSYTHNGIIAKDYHWVQPNKWQFLAEGRTDYYCNNGNLEVTICFSINVSSNNDTQEHSLNKTGMIKDFEKLFNNPTLSDIVMKSNDGVEFHSHKLVLATRSEVLKAHFEHNTVEIVNNIVEAPFDSEVLKGVLLYIYSENILLVHDMPEELLKASDFYNIEELKYICEKALQEKLTVENVIEIMQFAHTYMAENLKRFCLQFINDGNAKLIIETKSWEEASPYLIKVIAEYVIRNNYLVELFK